ncbi:DoxX family protein [Croceiramulus getboli]|nr:DoxX family protein [Flavobacteriaceae bacterium YJPT1-3]
MILITVLTVLTGLAFFIYGISCLFSPHMKAEFERFGLPGYRRLTGMLQLMGASGLLAGLYHAPIAFYASSGLGILMLLGFITRLKIRDGMIASSPAFIFMLINFFLAYAYSFFL